MFIRTYAKPPQRRCSALPYNSYYLRRRALLGQFCVSPVYVAASEKDAATNYPTLISILRGCACSAFGMRSLSTPFLNSAEAFSESSSLDKVKTRR